ncbi:unnamed protein product [Heligmosomoides polygyrus]|uniref:WD_REPEATS_REGION domain-containing protein n=1 Tax=Heligmosomoides polygyrus TaxID=6339 RepID=A0A183G0V4_HELPZ|nr:unnamed protein product [Heligmosomoides polygyrus]
MNEVPSLGVADEKESGDGEFKKPTLSKKREHAKESDGPDTKKPAERKLKFESTYLRSIPSANQYEKSFMHRDNVTHIIATETDFIITASADGHLKFWKKKYAEGVEFVKHFRCHLGMLTSINSCIVVISC